MRNKSIAAITSLFWLTSCGSHSRIVVQVPEHFQGKLMLGCASIGGRDQVQTVVATLDPFQNIPLCPKDGSKIEVTQSGQTLKNAETRWLRTGDGIVLGVTIVVH